MQLIFFDSYNTPMIFSALALGIFLGLNIDQVLINGIPINTNIGPPRPKSSQSDTINTNVYSNGYQRPPSPSPSTSTSTSTSTSNYYVSTNYGDSNKNQQSNDYNYVPVYPNYVNQTVSDGNNFSGSSYESSYESTESYESVESSNDPGSP